VVGNLSGEPEKDATASDPAYVRKWRIASFSKLAADQVPSAADLPGPGTEWKDLEAEGNGLVNISRVYGLPFPRPDRGMVWLKTTIHSSDHQQKHVSLGWTREIWIFVKWTACICGQEPLYA
jgi:hypothetical protein